MCVCVFTSWEIYSPTIAKYAEVYGADCNEDEQAENHVEGEDEDEDKYNEGKN